MLKEKIKASFEKNKKRYGSPRICRELGQEGVLCGRHRVARLMRQEGLAAHGKRKFKATTNSKHGYPIAPNLLDRNFTVSEPNRVWTGDITFIRTLEGWLYLAVVIDLYSRKVIGWAMGSRINAPLVVRALRMAIALRKPGADVIFHSDRGSQYACRLFQRIIRAFKFRPSMSRKGDCWDNSPTESFFATLKKELIRNLIYTTRRLAVNDIFYYIEGYYNTVRLHSTLDYNSPVQFENKAA